MARLRTIKPGFFLDEELAECQPLTRLLFAGLWCIADREGRLEDRPKRIKVEVLPYDDCDVDGLLRELEARGFIVRYAVSGAAYIAVPTFARHQNPHVKEAASVIPPPDDESSTVHAPGLPDASTVPAPDQPGRSCLVSCPVSCLRNGSGRADAEPVPVDNPAAGAEEPSKVSDQKEQSGPATAKGRPKGAKERVPTCDGAQCDVRDLRCGISSDVALIVGPADASTLYGGESDLSKTSSRYAGRVCQLCQEQFAATPRPQRDELCSAAMKKSIGRIVAVHQKTPIQNLPAYLNGELKQLTHLGDVCGDDTVAALRKSNGRRPKREPQHIGAVLPHLLAPEDDSAASHESEDTRCE